MNPVVFAYATWIALFPEFAPLSSDQGSAYFMRATASIIANSACNPMNADGNLSYLCYLATSHIAWLNCPRDANGNPAATGQAASPLVGRISSASEGSVSVQTEWEVGGSQTQLDAFLQQTKYGVELLAAMGPYRTARYLARPTIVVNGVYPGAGRGFGFGSGWGWGR